jgi:hypothetical protein
LKGLAGVLAALLMAGPAAADQPSSALQQIGLIGSWAQSCNKPASADNHYVIYYATTAGTVGRRLEIGPGLAAEATVEEAEILSPTRVRIRLRLDDLKRGAANHQVVENIDEILGDRLRVLDQTDGKGTQIIRDRTIIASGKPTDIFERCDARPYTQRPATGSDPSARGRG